MPTHMVLVDSRYRDTNAFPDPNKYIAEFNHVFKNVVSVELTFASYYKYGDEYYVSMHISELPTRPVVSNVPYLCDSFCQLPLLYHLNEYNGGYQNYRSVTRFQVPLEKLSKFTISFTDGQGNPYLMTDHILRFEIRTLERSGAIDIDNI